MNFHLISYLFSAFLLIGSSTLTAADWPMWRYDAEHRAASPEQLPDQLELQWTLKFSQREQVWDDPLNHDLMPYDRIFEPIVLGDRIFFTFNDSDKVAAYDTSNGSESWSFYSDGPVRLPPVGYKGNIYVTSDDGFLYCLAADTGKLRWKFRGGPSPLKVLGNKRVISAWPARGGPVIRDGHVYFATSIWPFMGTFIYSLNADTGAVEWVNDSTGSQYIKQPHSAPSFAGVAPQGALVATDKYLLVPGGRSVPAAFDRSSGKFVHFEINDGGKGNGGSFVIANGEEFFVHTRYRGVRNYNLSSGKKGSFTCNEPVLTSPYLYTATDEKGKKEVHVVDAKEKKRVWTIAADGTGDLIKAGDQLYAAGGNSLTAIDLSDEGGKGVPAWTIKVDGDIQRIIAANGKLFAVTLDGRIMAFGSGLRSDRLIEPPTVEPVVVAADTASRAAKFLEQAKARDGYCLWFGLDDIDLLESVLTESELQIVAVDPDHEKVEQLRRHFDAAGLYGKRITIHQGSPATFKFPPYIANLVHVDSALSSHLSAATLESLYSSVRPYGGSLSLDPGVRELVAAADLKRAEIAENQSSLVVFRTGALPDSADWTHQYGDIANSVKSDDSRLKLPLGVLWFGGNSNTDVLPRHGHGPPEQVIGGRMFIEGINSISARDVYTGRVLWIRQFDDLGTFGIYYNETYKDTPLDPAYNQKHIPGANGRGTNYVATEDAIYVAIDDSCHILDSQTGKTKNIIRLSKKWGFIGIYEDILIGGNGFANFSQKYAPNGKPVELSIEDYSASDGLVGFDRHTGERLWEVSANHSFLHNGIIAGDGRIYCLDKLPKSAEDKLKRRGDDIPEDYRILTIDSRTGEQLWEHKDDIFGTWLSYSTKHDIVLHAGASASDRLKDEANQGMITYRGKSGEIVWQRNDLRYSGPCILHNELIIANADQHSNRKGIGATSTVFSLLDGSDQTIVNPITGATEPWRIVRGKGCNSIIACENFLTFRDGAASYYDLENRNGIGSFGGFKSGCTANLIVANGVLNAPDYTRTCSCSYQNQTSLALVHMPDVELWTSSLLGGSDEGTDSIQRIGINFGAPGDRQSADGTMWLDYPSVGGRSPIVDVELTGKDLDYFRQHTSALTGSHLPWVMASGVRNVETISIRPETKIDSAPGSSPPGTIAADQNSDTGEESENGSVTITSSDLEMTRDNSPQIIGVRFRGLKLKRGQKIPPTSIQFTVDETGSKPTQLSIRAEATDNAKEIAPQDGNISSRDQTKASVSWSPKAWIKEGESGPGQATPDLAPLIAEVIARPGWKPGNAIAFIITGKGKRVAQSRAKGAPKLTMQIDTEIEKVAQVKPAPEKSYSVLLYFAEPDSLKPGERVFDVELQDKTVLKNVDLAKTAGKNQGLVKRFEGVRIGDVLKITLQKSPSATQQPILSGVELIAE
ncbi:MAG: outer membrane protein assembly factor BamB [Verrucomicrobiales bacterium]|jgi:outer membrane protein assembly factor BamB